MRCYQCPDEASALCARARGRLRIRSRIYARARRIRSSRQRRIRVDYDLFRIVSVSLSALVTSTHPMHRRQIRQGVCWYCLLALIRRHGRCSAFKAYNAQSTTEDFREWAGAWGEKACRSLFGIPCTWLSSGPICIRLATLLHVPRLVPAQCTCSTTDSVKRYARGHAANPLFLSRLTALILLDHHLSCCHMVRAPALKAIAPTWTQVGNSV